MYGRGLCSREWRTLGPDGGDLEATRLRHMQVGRPTIGRDVPVGKVGQKETGLTNIFVVTVSSPLLFGDVVRGLVRLPGGATARTDSGDVRAPKTVRA